MVRNCLVGLLLQQQLIIVSIWLVMTYADYSLILLIPTALVLRHLRRSSQRVVHGQTGVITSMMSMLKVSTKSTKAIGFLSLKAKATTLKVNTYRVLVENTLLYL